MRTAGFFRQNKRYLLTQGGEYVRFGVSIDHPSLSRVFPMLGTTAAPQAALRLTKTTSRMETDEWWGTPALDVFTGAANLLSAIGDPVRLQILWWLGKSE